MYGKDPGRSPPQVCRLCRIQYLRRFHKLRDVHSIATIHPYEATRVLFEALLGVVPLSGNVLQDRSDESALQNLELLCTKQVFGR